MYKRGPHIIVYTGAPVNTRVSSFQFWADNSSVPVVGVALKSFPFNKTNNRPTTSKPICIYLYTIAKCLTFGYCTVWLMPGRRQKFMIQQRVDTSPLQYFRDAKAACAVWCVAIRRRVWQRRHLQQSTVKIPIGDFGGLQQLFRRRIVYFITQTKILFCRTLCCK